MWHKGVQYLKKMGNVILMASILIWALGYFPRNVNYSEDYNTQIESLNNSQLSKEDKDHQVGSIEVKREAERQEKSYIGQLGHAIEPVIEPLGYDW